MSLGRHSWRTRESSGEANWKSPIPWTRRFFPRRSSSPTCRWRDDHTAVNVWLVTIEFADGKQPVTAVSRAAAWTPSPQQWRDIKARSLESPAKITVFGANQAVPGRLLSSAAIRISTSKDAVGAPLFYREVPLPFSYAVKNKSLIRWRFGPISSTTQPPIVLENLRSCGNCHSFSADGKHFGMDLDYANDKGSYVMSPVEEEMVLDPDKIITWADYKKEEKEATYGLLSQVSPDGKYAISTVKDREVFVPVDNLEFSQLFFPVKGILALYNLETKTFSSLPGANDSAVRSEQPDMEPGRQVCCLCPRPGAEDGTRHRPGRLLMWPWRSAKSTSTGRRSFVLIFIAWPLTTARAARPNLCEARPTTA